MIILSKLADYGVILAVRLAQPGTEQMTASALAQATRLPAATVAKVLKSLARADIVQAARGASGGYRLARPATVLTVAEVASAIDGPLSVTACTVGAAHDQCDRVGFCTTAPHWGRINMAVAAALASVTIAEMASPLPVSPAATRPLSAQELHA